MTDEWAFANEGGSRGPITRAQLAELLDKGILDGGTPVHHMTGQLSRSKALAECIEEWQRESMHISGELPVTIIGQFVLLTLTRGVCSVNLPVVALSWCPKLTDVLGRAPPAVCTQPAARDACRLHLL